MSCIKKIHLKIVGYTILALLVVMYMGSALAVLIASFFSDHRAPQWAEIAPGICLGMWAVAIGVVKKNKKKSSISTGNITDPVDV